MPISKVDQTLLRSTLKLYQRTPSGLYWQNEPKNQSEKDDDYQQLVLQNPSPLSSEVDNDEVLIQATNDVDAVRAWLAQHQDSANTFQSYRREAERLLLWALR